MRGLLELALPPACAGCGSGVPPDAALCARCDANLPRLPAHSCLLCGEAPRAADSRRGRCAACRKRALPFDACVASVAFEADAERFIRRFKYPTPGLRGLDPGPAAVACALIREAAHRAPVPRDALVVPVPLHRARLRARGYNPAALLARALAKARGHAWDPRALERVRDTGSQTALSRIERARNVVGAFRARAGRLPQRILLVDDVVTTGSTLREAARALRRAGARRIVCVCAARTRRAVPGPDPGLSSDPSLSSNPGVSSDPGLSSVERECSPRWRGAAGRDRRAS